MTDTFGNKHWRRPRDTGRAHSITEARNRASYDHQPAASGCLLLLLIAAGVLGVLLG